MPVFFQYLLKVSISLGIMYIFYLLVLRRLTFYNHNRWYLFCYSVLCYFIAFINIGPFFQSDNGAGFDLINLVPSVGTLTTGVSLAAVTGSENSGWTAWHWVTMAFLSGVVLLLIRLAVQLVSFTRLKKTAKLIADDQVRFYQVDRPIIPFSFGKSIYINQDMHSETELKEIIRHEFVHVKQGHTADIIWAELLCIVNWYNPFAWLIRKAIRQNLEFIADNNVISNGVDKKLYQYLLLKVVGNNHFSIASQFNFSSLKKRIVMMNKIKSTKVHLLKFLFILPLIAILLLAFRDKLGSQNENGFDQNGLTPDGKTEKPLSSVVIKEPANGQQFVSMDHRIDSKEKKGNLAVIDTVPEITEQVIREVRISQSLHRNDGMDAEHKKFFTRNPGINLLHWKENGDLEVYSTKGKLEVYSTAAEFKKFESKYGAVPMRLGSTGKIAPASPASPVSPASPASPHVPAGKVIERPVKVKPATSANKDLNLVYNVDAGGKKPIVFVDGQHWPSDISLNIIDPGKIESINVLKGETAIKLYGNKAGDGVISIVTKKQPGKITVVKGLPQPAYYLNGKKISRQAMDLIDPKQIKSIDVLKGNKATEKYGDEGKNGVIEITAPVVPTTLNNPVLPAWDFRNQIALPKKDEC